MRKNILLRRNLTADQQLFSDNQQESSHHVKLLIINNKFSYRAECIGQHFDELKFVKF
jgi:hypothetical protein